MIRPDRHTHLDYSVVHISAFILETLQKSRELAYDQMLSLTVKKLGKSARENYPYALNFLYILGKLAYDEERDTFIYLT